MPRVTFSLTPVVQVEVRGEPHPKGFPYLPTDDGLVSRFVRWLDAERIHPAIPGTVAGQGVYLAFYSAEDAERVAAWLREQGVEEQTP